MNLAEPFPGKLSIFHEEFKCTQTVDYKHIPFKCSKLHQHGHLFRDYPLNMKAISEKETSEQEEEGFAKVEIKKIHNKRAT